MSHLDEGTLHALLDGELDVTEAREVQSHLGTCVACGSRLQEVKQFLAEADRLVGALEMPAGATAPPSPPPSRQSAPFRRPQREPESWEETPVLLLPDNADTLARRRQWFRALRWAAMIVVVVGGGRLLLNVVGPHASLPQMRDFTTAAPPAAPPAVASPEETGQPEQPAAKAPTPLARTPAQNRALAAKSSQQAKAAATEALVDSVRESADTAADALADSTPTDTETLAAAGSIAESASTDSVARDTQAKDTQATDTTRLDDVATRRAAAEALAELDRQRRRDRAAAATAALQRPARAEAPAAAEPPAPRTPEQRAQIYLRIGLDEAAKQLGRPVHVIEGMTAEFIGLTYGRLVAGADPNRPVVRVVYVDSRGRMILLDQQRMRAGQAPAAAEGGLRWAVDDVMLYLRGEPGPDVLRSLQRRVR
jgi:chemotaxis protein histidine kinase CheA